MAATQLTSREAVTSFVSAMVPSFMILILWFYFACTKLFSVGGPLCFGLCIKLYAYAKTIQVFFDPFHMKEIKRNFSLAAT